MSFRETLNEDLRLHILKILSVAPGHSANNRVVQTSLDQVGHKRSAAMVAASLKHLEDVGAIKLEDLGPLQVASLAQAGLDAVEGRLELPGVRPPCPGE